MTYERHFTATAYLLWQDRILLHFHAKFGKWLPPGGHLEPNETPPECAVRESLEETGLEIELISEENVWVEESNASSFARPFMCLLENIPAKGSQEAHQHIDFIYIARPIGGELSQKAIEETQASWFSKEEVAALKEEELFEETRKTLGVIFDKFLDLPKQLEESATQAKSL